MRKFHPSRRQPPDEMWRVRKTPIAANAPPGNLLELDGFCWRITKCCGYIIEVNSSEYSRVIIVGDSHFAPCLKRGGGDTTNENSQKEPTKSKIHPKNA